MKTRSLMAAGVAAAGAGAVALTALTPTTQPELAAAPVASHQIVLTAFADDVKDGVDGLWSAVKAVPTSAQQGFALGSLIFTGNYGGRSAGAVSLDPGVEYTLLDLGASGSLTSVGVGPTPKSGLGATAGALFDGVTALQIALNGGSTTIVARTTDPNGGVTELPATVTAAGARTPIDHAVTGLATKINPAVGALVGGSQAVRNTVSQQMIDNRMRTGETVHRVLANVEKGDVKGAVNTLADRRQVLRNGLASYDANDKLTGGAIKAIRDSADASQTNVISKIKNQDVQKAVTKVNTEVNKVRDEVRKVVDKVGSTVKKTADKADKAVQKATD